VTIGLFCALPPSSQGGFSFHELDRSHEEAVPNQEDRFMSAFLSPSLADLQDRFVAIIPRITAHGQVYFRDVKCPGKKDDGLAEMIALSWAWFVRLVEKGKDPTTFVSAIASFAAKAVRSGRRLCGQERSKDVLSSVAQQRNTFTVSELPHRISLTSTPLQEALIDNIKTPLCPLFRFKTSRERKRPKSVSGRLWSFTLPARR
jgi:hypothetical protein